MKQVITQEHKLDENGNPAGGTTIGTGIEIEWQNGPLVTGYKDETVPGKPGETIKVAIRQEPNGAFVEGVIQAAIGRLEFYQGTKFVRHENQAALGYLNLALQELEKRTADRNERKVEGTHAV